MDKNDLSKVLRKLFATVMAETLPQFDPQGGKGKIQLPGWRSFLWTVAREVNFFVALGVDAHGAMFTVEGAWNDDPEYPTGQTPILLPNLKPIQVNQEELVFRLGVKDADGVVERPWWEPQSDKGADLKPMIQNAVSAVERDFMPIFYRRAARKGIQLVK